MMLLNRRIVGLGCWLVFASCLPGQGAHAQGAPHAAPVGAAATEATACADKGITLFRLYVQAAPSDPNAHDSLAEGLLAQGQVEEALAEYKRALGLDPYFSSSCLGLAQCYTRKAQGSQARDAYQRYLVLVPKGRSADDARKKIESLQKKQA